MTTSSNIAGVLKPIGILKRGSCPCCSGCICKIKDIPVNKKKKKRVGVYEVVNFDGGVEILEAKENRYIVKGKKGVWRTIRGRHYFFPDDKSGVIPSMEWAKR